IRLKVYTQDSQQLVESTYYEDNYFSLLPGKTKTIQLDYYTEDLKGEEAQLIVEGWNFGEARLPIEGSGSTTKVFSSE
ncbi:MAG: glycoside hydrolase family 2 protein, partial [Limnochordia bacterium]